MNLTELKQKPIAELLETANEMGLENVSRSRKQDIIFVILKRHAKNGADIYGDGVLEILQDGFGFLRSADSSYLAGPDDIYVSPSQIRRFNLRTGDTVAGKIRPPKDGERYFALLKISEINFSKPESSKNKILFENLTPLFPQDRLELQLGNGSTEDLSARVIDLTSPIGKGQRGLIVSPPKAGKTLILQNIAQSITKNNPEVRLIVLLIDERPEEVTDFRRNIEGEVWASSNDEDLPSHIRIADLCIDRAKRLVETGKDVVILMDSITRLARAHNSSKKSGRTMSGGLDIRALEKPRQLFAAARNTEEEGSLTIVASALIETGSRMDDMIFQEFKGTGNMEMVLDRKVADMRLYPAMNIASSGTRREELLIPEDLLEGIHFFRRALVQQKTEEATETMLTRLSKTESNQDLLDLINR